MGFNNITRKTDYFFILIILLIICVFMYTINKIYGFTIYPDEFGYWASAAHAVGYDWSAIASLSTYYTFGYSLILIPILFLFKNSVVAYRVALAVNMLMMCGGLYLLNQIITKLFHENNRVRKIFISAIGVFYPVWIFYMQMTLTEGLLMFLFILVTYLFINVLQEARLIQMVMLITTFIYMYTVHMRTIGVAIACVIILILKAIRCPEYRKKTFICLIILFILAFLITILQKAVIGGVYSSANNDLLSGNTYEGRLKELKGVFSPYSILPFIQGLIGKVYYLGMSSFGCFYLAIWWCIKQSVHMIKKLKENAEISLQEWIAMFLLLAAVGEILICNIAMYRGGVIDSIFYGRYDEFFLPVFIVIGVCVSYQQKHPLASNLIPCMLSGIMIPITFYMIERTSKEGIRGYFIAGMSYLLHEEKMNISKFMIYSWLFALLLTLLLSSFVCISKSTNSYWTLGAILLMEILLGFQISNHYIYQVNGSNYANLTISDVITKQEDETIPVYYLDDGSNPYIDYLQMQLQDKKIGITTIEEIYNQNRDMFLITNLTNSNVEEIKKLFQNHIQTNTFILYYN